MWNLIAILGLVVMLVGLASILKPIRRLGIGTRKRAALVAVGGFIVIGIGASNDPATQERVRAQRDSEGASANTEERASETVVPLTLPENVLPDDTRWKPVRSIDYGEDWPLTVNEGVLACPPPGSNVVFVHKRTVYALNGRARGYMKEYAPSWREIDSIHRDDPKFFKNKELVDAGVRPFKVSVQPLIAAGLSICE
jgi:hypothetical protein